MRPGRLLALVPALALAACADQVPTEGTAAPAEGAPVLTSAGTATNGKIAFVSQVDFDDEIFVMEADGSAPMRLTVHGEGRDVVPSWSPDGTRLAFARAEAAGQPDEIYLMNADGSGLVNLTRDPGADFEPAWSPDGSRIAFISNRDGNDEIYVMNADGSSPVRLTDEGEPDRQPSWSPDGSKIVFISERDDPGDEFFKEEVFVMHADGTNLVKLTNNTAQEARPSWSPDGSRILYQRLADRTARTEVFLMNADGSGVTNLTNTAAADGEPAWSPDGTAIVFASDRSGRQQIWRMGPDGSSPVQLTTGDGPNAWPTWQPVPAVPPYAFAGFFQPVDNLPTANVAKAGRSVPVKFALGGDQGLDIFRVGFPAFVAEPCDPSDPQDPIETTTSGSGGLSFDPATGRYTYTWKTPQDLAGRCGRLVLGLQDGSSPAALFRFTH